MGINLFYSCILLSTLILHLRACITGDNYMDAFGCTITGKDCDDGYEFTKCKQRVCKQYDYSQYEEDCYSAEIFDLGEDECA